VPATFTIQTFVDAGLGSGSLRDAIIQSNTTYQNQTNIINLSSGYYGLNQTGRFDDTAATGDLDITGTQTMIIQGAGVGITVISAGQIDRVFQVIGSGVTVTFKDLTITGGLLVANPDDQIYNPTDRFDDQYSKLYGGGILSTNANVTLDHVAVSSNVTRAGMFAEGGGIYASGGSLVIQNSTISNNIATYTTQLRPLPQAFNGARGADAPNDPLGTSTPPDGYPGGFGLDGEFARPPVDASGGGIYANNTTVQISNSTISSNSVVGGNGTQGGNGGTGGNGAVNNLSNAGHGYGGTGGFGGRGSRGGSATGAAIQVAGGSLFLSNVRVTNNLARGGTGGAGGAGGAGGDEYDGPGGQGGDGGKGGTAGAAITVTASASIQIVGATSISSNSASAGAGGVGGSGGKTGLPTGGFSFAFGGTGGVGGAGGNVSGVGLSIDSGTLTMSGASVLSNTAVAGAGGTGGGGGLGQSAQAGSKNTGQFGGNGNAGGSGGSVMGTGVNITGGTASILAVDIESNTGTAGNAGTGGAGGAGGAGTTVAGFFGTVGTGGGSGGDGGGGGVGGGASGGGLAATNALLTMRNSTVANNTLAAGAPGNGGSGGSGGNGGYGLFADGNGGDGGDGGSAGNAGTLRGGGVYFNTSAGSTVANTTVGLNTISTPTVTAKGGKAGAGGSGHSTGTVGSAGSDWTGSAANLGGGAYATGTLVVASTTIAKNSTGLAGGGTGVKFINTIIASNAGTDVNPSQGSFTSVGHNLIGTTTGTTGFGATGDKIGSDPLLTTLALRGGPTPVFGFLTTSNPIIDAGVDPSSILGSSLTTDQRGFPRQLGSAPDIGAVEYANNYVSASYSVPSTVTAGTDIQATATVLLGDGIFKYDASGGVNLPGSQVTLTPGTLPSGWTWASTGTGYTLHASTPASGIYTIPITIHVDSAIAYGTAIPLVFTDGINGNPQPARTTPTVTVVYPVPTLTSISPVSVNEGPAATLTVTGTGFGVGSVLQWNGTPLGTLYNNSTTLTAFLPATLAESGSMNLKVVNPSPGGGTSNTLSYSVNNVAPTGLVPDRYLVYPGSGVVNVTAGFATSFDPSIADRAAGLHYSYATTLAGLASTYAGAGTTKTYPVAVAGVGTTTYYARVFDKDGGFTDYTAKVYALASNTAPTLGGANDLPTINEDQTANTGVLVSDLIAGHFADSDAVFGKGIAVTGLTGTNGVWQYSTDGGSAWIDFPHGFPLGVPPSDAAATLLGAAPSDRVRFLPNREDGTTATIAFRAWDQTDGRNTGTVGVDVSASGGLTAYSSQTATATQIVTEVNDPPIASPLNYTMAVSGTLRIPKAEILAACQPGPTAEGGQTLSVVSVRVDTGGGSSGVATVSGSDIVYRPVTGVSGFQTLYYTIEDNGTTNVPGRRITLSKAWQIALVETGSAC